MTDNVKDNLANSDNWLRVLLVLLYALIFTLAVWVLAFAVGLNLLILLFTGERNDNLAQFGDQLSRYLAEVMAYGTLNTNLRPFPFGEWPGDSPADSAADTPASAPPPAAPPAAAPPAESNPATAPKKKATRKKTAKKKAASKAASKPKD